MHVTLRSYTFLTGILFSLIGLAHAVRLYYDWNIQIGEWSIPTGASWAILILMVLIAWEAMKLSKGGK